MANGDAGPAYTRGAGTQPLFQHNAAQDETYDPALDTVAALPFGLGAGAQAHIAAMRQQAEQRRQEEIVNNLLQFYAPQNLETELFTERQGDEWGSLRGGPSALESARGAPERTAQLQALAQLQNLAQTGGYTDADRAMSNAARLSRGAQMRGATQAALQQAQARGAGGGGQELLARMTGAQSANTANAMADAQVQQAAMQRALQAMAQGGQLGTTMYDQEMQRRAALDAWNRQQLDWRRGREQRNTERYYRQEQDRVGAEQARSRFAQDAAAMATGQYSTAANERQAALQAQQQAGRDQATLLGSVLTAL